MTPTPRLVPDRPSDAAIAQAHRELGELTGPQHPANSYAWVMRRAREIDAATTPAEAPLIAWLREESRRVKSIGIDSTADRLFDAAEMLAALTARVAELESDAERIASCPWRVQKGCTALCQPPKSLSYALQRAEQAEARLAAPAAPAEGDYAGEVVNFTNGMTASGPPMTIIAAKPLPYGTKLYTTPRVTGKES